MRAASTLTHCFQLFKTFQGFAKFSVEESPQFSTQSRCCEKWVRSCPYSFFRSQKKKQKALFCFAEVNLIGTDPWGFAAAFKKTIDLTTFVISLMDQFVEYYSSFS
jgi:hypothetical protein